MLTQLLHILVALTNNTSIGNYAQVRENVVEDYVVPSHAKNFRRYAEAEGRSFQNGAQAPFLTAADCKTYLFKAGENELVLSSTPKGYCQSCCPPKYTRDVLFVFYNKKNPYPGTLVAPLLKQGAAQKAGVKSDLPTVIFIHGFSERSPGMSGKAILEAYLSRKEDYNIILLNWTELTAFPWYDIAVKNVKIVANILKQFLEFYNDSGEIPISKVHLIGFSLGAHIASFAGKTLRKDLKIPRITGLDPALPSFPLKDSTRRLTYTDAQFVDVIHTDAGVLGFPVAIGSADFYPNGGTALQPGCQPSFLVQIRLAEHIIACSHVRAWHLYAESVKNPKAFPATKCKVWRGPNKKCDFKMEAYLGFPANLNNTKGRYYLLTKNKKPFARNIKEQMFDAS